MMLLNAAIASVAPLAVLKSAAAPSSRSQRHVVSHVAQPLVVEPQTSECSPGMPLHQKCCVELSGHVTVLFSSTSQRHVTLRTAGVALLAAAVPGMTSSTGVLSGAGVGANVAVGAAEIDGADVVGA